MIGKIRKGDIIMANLPSDVVNCLQDVHPCLIMSNHLTCQSSMGIQVVPFTSKEKNENNNHILVPSGIGGLKQDSIALCECIKTIDKSCMLYKIGSLPMEYIREIDKGTAFQLNLNRNFNIEMSLRQSKAIKELDKLANGDGSYKKLRETLVDNLKEYCKTYNIDYNRLFD